MPAADADQVTQPPPPPPGKGTGTGRGSGIFWLASFPKSGNTWFRTFLRNLTQDGSEPVDINDLSTGQIASSRLWLDEVLGFDTADLTADEIVRLRPDVYDWSAAQSPEPGYHKTHDAWTLTPQDRPMLGGRGTRGALYLLRNPLDVAPSLANHNGTDIDTAIATMGQADNGLSQRDTGLSLQVPQHLGTWSAHVLSWVDAPGLACHVLRYEDMQARPLDAFAAAARFLDLPDDPARIRKAVEFSAFDILARQEETRGFRERSAQAPRFFRAGRSGGWRAQLTPAQVDRIIADHGPVMARFGYLDASGTPV